MWQKCPICNGNGTIQGYVNKGEFIINETVTCTTCNGKKIISTLTGNPPIELDLLKGDYKCKDCKHIHTNGVLCELCKFESNLNICPTCGKFIKLPGNGIVYKLCECNLK